MNDIASWLRAQIPSSTHADRLERLAREAERQAMLRSGIATMVKERTPSKPHGIVPRVTSAELAAQGLEAMGRSRPG